MHLLSRENGLRLCDHPVDRRRWQDSPGLLANIFEDVCLALVGVLDTRQSIELVEVVRTGRIAYKFFELQQLLRHGFGLLDFVGVVAPW